MRDVLIIGNGVSGMACALRCAELGLRATIVSPYGPERAQSVMAAGGVNAVPPDCAPGDSVASHIADTLRGGRFPGERAAVEGLCAHAGETLEYLERIGVVFSVDAQGRPLRRAFGGQSYERTYFCGAATGKLIVSALVMELRRYEALGLIVRRDRCWFHSALLRDGVCRGALVWDGRGGRFEPICADAVVMATGGQNALFGKTTGSRLCDGYAAGQLFLQGAALKNPEFIQYHPTTLETAQKRMLVSEAARGEGGRLFYEENGRRVYFMEDKYGPRGNLMTRDVVAREIDACGREVFLDIAFLGPERIAARLPEVAELCRKYRGIDVTREPIPVAPSVHFFMGGLAVRPSHETSVPNLFAVGECAAIYHGANRLGGNSLLAALYGGRTAAETIAGRTGDAPGGDFTAEAAEAERQLRRTTDAGSPFPVMYLRDMLADTMREHLGIVRSEAGLRRGLEDVYYLLSVAGRIRYDSSVPPYENYSLAPILRLARAVLEAALARRESRGAHWRSDFPEESAAFAHATLVTAESGARLDEEGEYES